MCCFVCRQKSDTKESTCGKPLLLAQSNACRQKQQQRPHACREPVLFFCARYLPGRANNVPPARQGSFGATAGHWLVSPVAAGVHVDEPVAEPSLHLSAGPGDQCIKHMASKHMQAVAETSNLLLRCSLLCWTGALNESACVKPCAVGMGGIA